MMPEDTKKQTRRTWEEGFQDLKDFLEENSPHSTSSDRLKLRAIDTLVGGWAAEQRTKRSELTALQVARLDELQFDWESSNSTHIDKQWNDMFERLQQYKAQFGDCLVPYGFEEDCDGLPKKLGVWTYAQRSHIPHKAESGDPVYVERKRQLDDMGFIWDNTLHDNWERIFQRLEQYKEEHGHCRVSRKYEHGCVGLPITLGSWVMVQGGVTNVKAKSDHPVYVERKRRLDEIGFEWDNVIECRWDDMFERLRRYYVEHGNCRVPSMYEDAGNDGPSLGSWTRTQKSVIPFKVAQSDELYLERQRQLDSIGFEWDTLFESRWKGMFETLKRFREEHGHCRVPLARSSESVEDSSPRDLGGWCYEQRKNIPPRLEGGDSIYQERKRLLDSVDFEWDVLDEKEKRWRIMFERLRQYKREFGCSRVPSRNEDESDSVSTAKLASWVRNQQDGLPAKAESGDPVYVERKRRLDSIGFEWNRLYEEKWEVMFKRLVEYKENHDNCRVPYRKKNKAEGQQAMLGIWVYSQRTQIPPKAKNGDPVSVERKRRLESIGFEWQDAFSSQWDVMFQGLKRFEHKYGDTRVPRTYVDVHVPLPANLGSWVICQRSSSILAKAECGEQIFVNRKERLDAIGFPWKAREKPRKKTEGCDRINTDGSAPTKRKVASKGTKGSQHTERPPRQETDKCDLIKTEAPMKRKRKLARANETKSKRTPRQETDERDLIDMDAPIKRKRNMAGATNGPKSFQHAERPPRQETDKCDLTDMDAPIKRKRKIDGASNATKSSQHAKHPPRQEMDRCNLIDMDAPIKRKAKTKNGGC